MSSVAVRNGLQLLSCGADKSIMFRTLEKVSQCITYIDHSVRYMYIDHSVRYMYIDHSVRYMYMYFDHSVRYMYMYMYTV